MRINVHNISILMYPTLRELEFKPISPAKTRTSFVRDLVLINQNIIAAKIIIFIYIYVNVEIILPTVNYIIMLNSKNF